LKPGDIVVAAFPGAQLTKTRPAVVISTEGYNQTRPDIILGLITSQVPAPLAPSDCALRDWKQAGLHSPSYFRLFLVTFPQREVRLIGRLTELVWESVLTCCKMGLAGA